MTTHTGPIRAQRHALTVIDCIACGWAHLDPLPDAAALATFYSSDFWQTYKAGWGAQYEVQRDWLAMRHADWLTVLESHTPGRTLLDVGCGWGHFLEAARAREWGTWGIEPSDEAFDYMAARAAQDPGDRVLHANWEEFDRFALHVEAPPGFDAITAFWLVEHLPDPVAFLQWVADHLAEGGALMLAVPQEWTALQARANDVAAVKHYWLDPTHLHYWHRESLFALLARCGFRVVDALATFPVEEWILAGDDYTADAARGAAMHTALRGVELRGSREWRLRNGRHWADHRMGRDLVVVAKVNA